MPAKNKPKRLNRSRSWRVARRKKKQAELASPVKRSRAKRPKKQATFVEKPAPKKLHKRK